VKIYRISEGASDRAKRFIAE